MDGAVRILVEHAQPGPRQLAALPTDLQGQVFTRTTLRAPALTVASAYDRLVARFGELPTVDADRVAAVVARVRQAEDDHGRHGDRRGGAASP